MSLFLELMRDGGPIMWVILFCSVVALFIFLKKVLRRDGFVEALTLCDHTPGPAARLLAAAIRAYERGDDDIRKAVDDAALEEIPKLERHINLLSTLGFVLPLIGFLGTVLGMMKVFQVAQTNEAFSATDIAGAVNMALISTAAALAVAIPCYLAYNYLIARVNLITLDMEKASLEMLGFIERRRREGGAAEAKHE